MSITSPYIKVFNLFLISIILISVHLQEVDDLCLGETCKSILMKEKIIFINDNANNISINYYDFQTQNSVFLRNYATSNIIYYKNILKINEGEFIIYGLNLEISVYMFYYDIYSITENNGNININADLSANRNFVIYTPDKIDAKILKDTKKLIIFGIMNSYFQVFLINLESTRSEDFLKFQFPQDTNIDSRLTYQNYRKENIQCNSLDGNNFFCTFFYSNRLSSTGDYTMFYINGNFSNANEKTIRVICDQDCLNGNIETINNDKYLLCYQKSSNSYFFIICQYYTLYSNSIEEGKEIFQYFTPNVEKFALVPLLIYKYDKTIFVQFDYRITNNEYAYIINLSTNFKIYLDTKLIDQGKGFEISTVNFYNDDNYFYHTYKIKRDTTSNAVSDTKIYRTKLIQCQPQKNLTLSVTNDKLTYNFLKDHENMEIRFSINDNLHLNPSITYYNPANAKENNFTFQRGVTSGILDNYYIYSLSNSFSLICPLNITSCFSLCDYCEPNQEGTSDEQYCTKCINGYHPKEDVTLNYFNCYEENKLLMYYYNDINQGKFLRCNLTCKYCDNSNSCKACADGYYFKYEDNELKNNTICFKDELEEYYLSTNEKINNSYKDFNEVMKK